MTLLFYGKYNREEMNNFLYEIHTAEHAINFTLEVEESNELAVLDFLVYNTGDTFKITVHRKETHTNR